MGCSVSSRPSLCIFANLKTFWNPPLCLPSILHCCNISKIYAFTLTQKFVIIFIGAIQRLWAKILRQSTGDVVKSDEVRKMSSINEKLNTTICNNYHPNMSLIDGLHNNLMIYMWSLRHHPLEGLLLTELPRLVF